MLRTPLPYCADWLNTASSFSSLTFFYSVKLFFNIIFIIMVPQGLSKLISLCFKQIHVTLGI